jgi:DNA-binding transcriptional MerR regulator
MPEDQNAPESLKKLYYSISEVSDMLAVKPHVLRYWESQFGALRPKKNRAGNRMYRERDVEILRRIQELLHVRRYTIAGARRELARLRSASASPPDAVVEIGEEEAGEERGTGTGEERSTLSEEAIQDGGELAGAGVGRESSKPNAHSGQRKAHAHSNPSQIALEVPPASVPARGLADLRREIVGLKEWLESRERG